MQTRENGQKPHFDPFLTPNRGTHFFLRKSGFRHFSPIIRLQLCVQNLKNPMVGSIITFVTDGQTDGLTDWRTDEHGYIGPNRVGPKIKILHCIHKNPPHQTTPHLNDFSTLKLLTFILSKYVLRLLSQTDIWTYMHSHAHVSQVGWCNWGGWGYPN